MPTNKDAKVKLTMADDAGYVVVSKKPKPLNDAVRSNHHSSFFSPIPVASNTQVFRGDKKEVVLSKVKERDVASALSAGASRQAIFECSKPRTARGKGVLEDAEYDLCGVLPTLPRRKPRGV